MASKASAPASHPREVLQVSCVQMHWAKDLEENVAKTLGYVGRARSEGSDLVLFPETNLTGYDFDYVIGLPANAVKNALKVVAKKAAECSIYVIVGSLMRRRGDRLLNLSHVIAPSGQVFYEYAKVHMAGSDERKHCRPGNKLALFKIAGHLCTLIICRDGRHPELYRIPAMAGAKVLFHSSCSSEAIEGVSWKRLAGRAQQPIGPNTFIYHCVANTVGQSRDGTQTSSGMSFIKDPTGLS
ncbi:carbon-nitrogen hydrolase family protein, partial [Candidatus Sumerlaeota bacterium]|nr:carbon-nitrogen hydrolase family protein [Candidatus Sumerlaeota bacterium]